MALIINLTTHFPAWNKVVLITLSILPIRAHFKLQLSLIEGREYLPYESLCDKSHDCMCSSKQETP